MHVKWANTAACVSFSPSDGRSRAHQCPLPPFIISKLVVEWEKPIRTCEYTAETTKELWDEVATHTPPAHTTAFPVGGGRSIQQIGENICAPPCSFISVSSTDKVAQINLKRRTKPFKCSYCVCTVYYLLTLHWLRAKKAIGFAAPMGQHGLVFCGGFFPHPLRQVLMGFGGFPSFLRRLSAVQPINDRKSSCGFSSDTRSRLIQDEKMGISTLRLSKVSPFR